MFCIYSCKERYIDSITQKSSPSTGKVCGIFTHTWQGVYGGWQRVPRVGLDIPCPATHLSAGETPGTYCVTAVCDNVPAEVQIQVKKEVTQPKPEIQTKITSLHWDGKVDPFKWSNFYNRLIIKLMKSGKLDLSINLSVNNRDGISQEMVDEIRVALKELELDEDIQMNKSVYDY